MIIWSGWGILVVLVAGIGMALGAAVAGALGLAKNPFLTLALGLLLASLCTYGLTALLGRRKERVLLDPQTGEQVVLRYRDSLFFVPVRIWTWIFLVLGAIAAGAGLLALVR
jgi:hypothetical protein